MHKTMSENDEKPRLVSQPGLFAGNGRPKAARRHTEGMNFSAGKNCPIKVCGHGTAMNLSNPR